MFISKLPNKTILLNSLLGRSLLGSLPQKAAKSTKEAIVLTNNLANILICRLQTYTDALIFAFIHVWFSRVPKHKVLEHVEENMHASQIKRHINWCFQNVRNPHIYITLITYKMCIHPFPQNKQFMPFWQHDRLHIKQMYVHQTNQNNINDCERHKMVICQGKGKASFIYL